MCVLGQVDAILGVSCEHFGAIWVYLGAMGHVGAILGALWEVLEVLGFILGLRVYGLVFRVWGLRFDHHNAYLFEMPKSLSTYACAAKTLA